MLLLKQEDIQKMAYQTHNAVTYSYGDEENLRKKFNRKIVRNYILFTLLGAALATGAIFSTKNPELAKTILIGSAGVGITGLAFSVSIESILSMIQR